MSNLFVLSISMVPYDENWPFFSNFTFSIFSVLSLFKIAIEQ